MDRSLAIDDRAFAAKPPGRVVVTGAACLLLGFIINFAVAAALGARPDRGPALTGFGFVSRGFAPTVNWCGSTGRDLLAVAADPGLEGATFKDLESRFRSVFGQPKGSMTTAELEMWSARLFPRWGRWAYGVNAYDASRRVYAAGFPLRSFAGYDTNAYLTFSLPKPAGPYREVGFLWRDANSPIRAVVYIPLALGAIVNSLVLCGAARWSFVLPDAAALLAAAPRPLPVLRL